MNFSSFVDSPAWTIAGWSLLHYLWVGALLGCVAWTLKRAVRPLAPQARYAVALLMFVLLAVAPPVVAWRVATQPATIIAGDYPAIAAATALEEATRPRMTPAPALSRQALATDAAMTPPVETIEAFVVRHCTSVLAVCVRWAPAVWLVGMPLTLAFLATGLFGAERLRQRSSPLLDGPIADAAQRWAEALRITRRVAIGVSDRVVAPLVIGVLRPMIVLPASIVARQSPEQMEMILLHELAHVRRADNLVNLFQRVIEAVLFFQPAVWFVSRWVRLEREHCCDIVVLSYTGDPQGYAETLASLAMPGISPAYAAAAMANHQLVSRIQHILSSEEQTMSLSPKLAVLAGAICLVIGLSLSGAAQQQTPGETDKASVAEVEIEALDAAKAEEEALDKAVSDKQHAQAVLDEVARAEAARQDIDGLITLLDENNGERVNVTQLGESTAKSSQDTATWIQFLNRSAANESGKPPAWSAARATGAPDVLVAGDSPNAWASLSEDDQDEWLELTYDEPVEVIAVQVFANYNPGAVAKVTVFDAGTAGLQYTWQGEDPVKASGRRARGVSIIAIPATIKTNRVRVEIASKAVRGWNEIDAVGLLDAGGKTHWATGATASTSYADRATQASKGAITEMYLYDRAINDARLALDQQTRQYVEQTRQRNGDATEQWQDITRARATNSALDGRDWSPDQATGAPADLSAAEQNDRRHAWRPAKPDAGRETLNVMFDTPVKAKLLLVYELGVPATVDVVCSGNKTEVSALIGRNLKSATSGVLSIPLDGKLAINTVTLGLDTAAVKGWSDIDAVGLIDAEGKVHWANRARATSTHADLADAAMRAASRGAQWLQEHTEHTRNVSCKSCHDEPTGADSGSHDSLKSQRVKVRELLDKSDAELRDWLNTHGAANIRIEHDGTATLEPAASDKFQFNSGDAAAATGELNFDVKAADDTESKAATKLRDAENSNQQDATQQEYTELSKAEVAAAESRLEVAKAVLEKLKAREQSTARLQAEYERAYQAQLLAASRDAREAKERQLRGRWDEVSAIANRVQIQLSAGEKGAFSIPGRRIVRTERVESPHAKNVLSITITGDGLEFVGVEPGTGLIRCWDQNGDVIEVAVEVQAMALPKPKAATELDPTGKPKSAPMPATDEGSKSEGVKHELNSKIDRFVAETLNKKTDPQERARQTARRVYLDVLGVPPTAVELDEFVGDGKPETFDRAVRELLKRAGAKPQPEQ